MNLSSSKRRWTVAAIVLLFLFLVRPGASKLKSRIIASISSGVGRPADIGSVHLRLLPRPGFDLENLVVYDDPAFGAEPMLRAAQVTAWLRLTSLLRGRLEIARLNLTEPSMNLVHGENGHWNLETLLERTARTPLAPTSKAKSEPRSGFPYIEATSARINFKSGPEKKPYALTNADFSLWQESENAWGVRLQGQPMRGDLNLNDTGILRVNGRWQRAATFPDTPLDFTLEWSRAQLGQLTKFLTGRDRGWRGGVQLDLTLAGTPAKLLIATDASIQDFRRYDITSGQPLRLAAHCDGQYSTLDHTFHEVVCSAPVKGGLVALKGEMGVPGSRNYGLELAAENVPVGALVAVAERAKKNLPVDLAADGVLRGGLSIHEGATAKLRLEGKGEISDFHLVSATSKSEIGPETVPFAFTSGDDLQGRANRLAVHKDPTGIPMPEGPHLEFGPFFLGTGRAESPSARGWASLSGYTVVVNGSAELGNMLHLADMFGIPALQAAASGTAQIDLQIAGSWMWANDTASGFPGPQVTGSAALHSVRVGGRGLGRPVEITTAELQFSSDKLGVQKLSARAAGTLWTGSLEMPRGCGSAGACEVRFNLTADKIALGELSEWLNPRPKERPWYQVLQSSPQAGPSFPASVHGTGRVATDRLQIGSVNATHVSAWVVLGREMLLVSQLNADFLGGKHQGTWHADFSTKPALCGGSGALTRVSLSRLAEGMKDAWITGTGNANYQVQGACTAGFWSSGEGMLNFDVTNGVLPHISLDEDGEPLGISRMKGQARLHAGTMEIKDAKLDSPDGKFLLSGTASLKRELDLKLTRGTGSTGTVGYNITGTLAQPRIVPLPGMEQARLKPAGAK